MNEDKKTAQELVAEANETLRLIVEKWKGRTGDMPLHTTIRFENALSYITAQVAIVSDPPDPYDEWLFTPEVA